MKKDEASKRYTEEYHRRMEGRGGGGGGGGGGGRGAAGDDYYGDDPSGMSFMELVGMGSPSGRVTEVGCYSSESALGSDKVYAGSEVGTQIELALQFAASKGKKYVAISRAGVDGHAFAFNNAPKKSMGVDDEGCDGACLDRDDYTCGCADALCGGVPKGKGEDNLRRWMVYEVPLAQIAEMQRAGYGMGAKGGKPKGKAKGKPKAKAKGKSEL